MFWMKASDKTIATNAYVSGFGASKRIVIWDTAIAQELPTKSVADFGHEMATTRSAHLEGICVPAALLFVLLYLGYRDHRLGARTVRCSMGGRGLEDWLRSALLLLLSVFSFDPMPSAAPSAVSGESSRHLRLGSDPRHHFRSRQACAQSFQTSAKPPLVDPDPNPVQVFLFYRPSDRRQPHPPLLLRMTRGPRANRPNSSINVLYEIGVFLCFFRLAFAHAGA